MEEATVTMRYIAFMLNFVGFCVSAPAFAYGLLSVLRGFGDVTPETQGAAVARALVLLIAGLTGIFITAYRMGRLFRNEPN